MTQLVLVILSIGQFRIVKPEAGTTISCCRSPHRRSPALVLAKRFELPIVFMAEVESIITVLHLNLLLLSGFEVV